MNINISSHFSDKIYNVVDNSGNVVDNVLAKKYQQFKHMFNEYGNLVKIKHIKNTTNIVETDTREYIIYIEKFKGTELFKVLTKRNNFSQFETRNIINQLLIIISNLENVKVTHTDIKLENIIYNTKTGEVNLIDFENNCFTENYIPPELINKHKTYDTKTVMWAIGVITYLLLFGKFPFKNNTDTLSNRIIKEEDLNIEISSSCKNFITRCLDKNYTKRIDIYNAINHNWFKSENKNSKFKSNRIISYLFS